eukprot:CAMPEP_0168443154 /NCGR_PEP_ID=MMETSP0228-20121227/44382_1 /TAXON_ID=133427 /ORGANISM="Protoceratium reticulatum, Strain CCCM 535 (=CCMP 1889)" /LENGTH=195 /DNA_ID=CAMNT_0008457547 /DNA_START=67 /DNA_END=650 /DNA_ORIENTATION=+
MAGTLRRILVPAVLVAVAGAVEAELERELQALEQQFQENRAQIQGLEDERRLQSALPPSIFGASPNTRAYTSDESFEGALNHTWLIICGALVMFMQAGFAMLEAGACRRKFVQNIMLKNLTDVCIGTIGWWVFGWSFAYSGPMDSKGVYKKNGFGGHEQFMGHHFLQTRTDGQQEPTTAMASWFFQWAFASAAAT